jgi:hypothetical protein
MAYVVYFKSEINSEEKINYEINRGTQKDYAVPNYQRNITNHTVPKPIQNNYL